MYFLFLPIVALFIGLVVIYLTVPHWLKWGTKVVDHTNQSDKEKEVEQDESV